MYKIFGGGVLGTLLSLELSQESKEPIYLYEQNEKLLSAFNSCKFDNYFVNPGHHAIEMPRGIKTYEILKKASKYVKLKTVSSYRFICISGKISFFTDTIETLPEELSLEFISLKNNSSNIFYKSCLFRDYLLNSDSIYAKAYQACMKRYSDEPIDTWHLFYPWMFPTEFKFETNDEGDLFQNNVRELKIKSYIAIPSEELFSNISSQITSYFKENNVNVNLNYKNAISDLTRKNNCDEKKIWCGPAFALSKEFGSIEGLIKSSRYFYLLLFEIKKSNDWLQKFERFEMLFMDPNFYYLSRVSRAYFNSNKFFLAELFFENKLNKVKIKNIGKELEIYFRKLFDSEINYLDGVLQRNTYVLNGERVKEENEILAKISNKYNFLIPQLTWGPQNLSKSGISAYNHARII